MINHHAFADYLVIVLNGLRRRWLRTSLTMIGIFIGIAAVVALVSISQGMKVSIDEQFQKLGYDKLIIAYKGDVIPGMGGGEGYLTTKDADFIKRIRGIEDVIYFNNPTAAIEYKDQKIFYIIIGYPTDEKQVLFDEFLYPDIIEGRKLRKSDKYKVTVGIGYKEDNVFKTNLKTNAKLKINGQDFEVVGVYDRIGNPQDDMQIYMPEDTMKELFNLGDRVSSIIAKTAPGESPSDIAERVRLQLANYRDVKEGNEDFIIQSSEDMMKTITDILNIIQVVLVGIAFISLFVGGIGIMNTMYTAVTERTQQIGIMKAIGARNEDIMAMFLIESGILGLAGGTVGIIIGYLFAKAVELIAIYSLKVTLLKPFFPWYLLVGSLLFAFIVGALAGTLPAINASKLQPVEALRYE